MGKIIAIMQPTYLPWLGYFDLMDQSDMFVLLDSVQFDKRSWQQRNKIKTPNEELLITVPVLSKSRFKQKISETEIDKTFQIQRKHIKAIKYNYSKAKYFNRYIKGLENILSANHTYLADLTIELICWIKDILGIKTELIRSSSIITYGKKAELLVNICNTLEAKFYLSPLGSKRYIEVNDLFMNNGIKIYYQDFIHPNYNQLYEKFISYLSVIDLLFNEGDKSLSIIRSGRKSSIHLEHVEN